MHLSWILWLLILAAAALLPGFAEPQFLRFEAVFRQFADGKARSWILVGSLALLLRLALLPVVPIPKPVIYDEFSYLLAADTFAAGRATNPAPPVPTAFESPYILVTPTYASRFPPAPALAMAIAQRILGHPWFGVWLSAGCMCAAICWALQGFLPLPWALLGGLLSLPLGVTTYWVDSYWGGAIAAAAGAVALGCYARIAHRGQPKWGYLLGISLAVLANTRLFEGAILSAVIAVALLRRRAALACVVPVLCLASAAMLWYNWRVCGNALHLPYLEYESRYSSTPVFSFLPLRPLHFFSNPVIEDLHHNWDQREYAAARSAAVLTARPALWWQTAILILNNPVWILLAVAFLPLMLKRRELRLPLLALALAFAGSLAETFYHEHYPAPLTLAFFLAAAAALKELRPLMFRGRPAGRFLSRAIPAGAFLLFCRSELPLLLNPPNFESTHPVNARKQRLQSTLLKEQPGPHLILVRYTGTQSPHEEWVYNGADLSGAPVLWAHDLGDLENPRLLKAFPNRSVWLFEPDSDPERFIRQPR